MRPIWDDDEVKRRRAKLRRTANAGIGGIARPSHRVAEESQGEPQIKRGSGWFQMALVVALLGFVVAAIALWGGYKGDEALMVKKSIEATGVFSLAAVLAAVGLILRWLDQIVRVVLAVVSWAVAAIVTVLAILVGWSLLGGWGGLGSHFASVPY